MRSRTSRRKPRFIVGRSPSLAWAHSTSLASKSAWLVGGKFGCVWCKNESVFPSQLVWFDATHQKGHTIDYRNIVLHGVSRDTTEFPRMHIYCQLCETSDAEEVAIEEPDGDQEIVDKSDKGMHVEEVRLAPNDCTHRKSLVSGHVRMRGTSCDLV
jgi:hypothetical protein